MELLLLFAHSYNEPIKIDFMKKFVVLFCFVFYVFAANTSFSQVKIDSSEIISNVPELTGFHEIIFPMWHTAYPAKDINALKGFVPQIKVSMEAINRATLPGILKDKEADWKNQLKELNVAAENYYKASEGNDDEALLVAAEKLHYNFEMMNRVIRPVLKEIDAYHQILYIIYHKLYPVKKYDVIAALMDGLIEKADAIAKYPREKLKKRLGENISKFDAASRELYDETVSLKEVLQGDDLMKKDEAVQHVHSLYQNLESVFN
jgi:hypothetical protein